MNSLQHVTERNLVALAENPYPGRGIVLGRSASGKHIVQIYWIMGRSENSRNRNFRHDGVGRVFTEAADPAKVSDPSLIIYNAMRERHKPDLFVVSNGHQTDGAWEYLTPGLVPTSLLQALTGWKYEPDEPNFTPRITGLSADPKVTDEAQFVLLKRGAAGECLRQLFVYPVVPAGVGYCVTTYRGDGNPLPAFVGEPYPVPLLSDDIETIAQLYWNALNKDNRVSLAVKMVELGTNRASIHLINKHSPVGASR